MLELNKTHMVNQTFIDDEAPIRRRRPSPRRGPSQSIEKFIADNGAPDETDFDSLLYESSSRYDSSEESIDILSEIGDMTDEGDDAYFAEPFMNENHQALDDTLNTSNIDWALRFSKQFEGKQNERYSNYEPDTQPILDRKPEVMDVQAKINSINLKYKDIFDVKQNSRDTIVKEESVTKISMQRTYDEEDNGSNIETNISSEHVPLPTDNSLSLADITRDFIAMEVSIKHLGHSIKERLSRIQNLYTNDCDENVELLEQKTQAKEDNIILEPDYQEGAMRKPTTSIVKSLRFDPIVATVPDVKSSYRDQSDTSSNEWYHPVKSQDIVEQPSSPHDNYPSKKDIFSRRIVTRDLPKKEMKSERRLDTPINDRNLPHTKPPALEMKSSYLLSSSAEHSRDTPTFNVSNSPPQRENSVIRNKQFLPLTLHSSFLLVDVIDK